MRRLEQPTESSAPDSFRRWKKRHPNAKYSGFHNARAKNDLKDNLIVRQKFLCCYCESRVSRETSHIEHIEPQFGGLSSHTLDVSNMAVSCIKDPKKFEQLRDPSRIGVLRDSYLHCGHARGTNRVVSPYDPVCERLFEYSFGGEIRVSRELTDPAEIRLARDSIENLRLNVPPLVNLRRLVMFETVRLLDKGVSADEITREINGMLPPFVSNAKVAALAWRKSHPSKQ